MFTLRTFERLDAGQPVNWSHPLNRGLLSWWMVSPGGHPAYRGGSRLLDLCRRNHGTLSGGPTWSGNKGRKGGFGAISFDANDDQVTLAATGLTSGAAKSLAFWMYAVTPDALARIFTSGVAGQTWAVVSNETGGALSPINYLDGGADPPHLNSVLSNSTWYHIVMTYDGTTKATYVNGAAVGTTGTDPISFSPTDVTIGRRSDLTTRTFGGLLDSIRLYNYGLSASQVPALYALESRPDSPLLNWSLTRFVNSAAVTFDPAATSSWHSAVEQPQRRASAVVNWPSQATFQPQESVAPNIYRHTAPPDPVRAKVRFIVQEPGYFRLPDIPTTSIVVSPFEVPVQPRIKVRETPVIGPSFSAWYSPPPVGLGYFSPAPQPMLPPKRLLQDWSCPILFVPSGIPSTATEITIEAGQIFVSHLGAGQGFTPHLGGGQMI